MIVPTVHLNGTSKRALLDAHVEARSYIRLALKAMGEAYPHGRDYYPQGVNALPAALDQHAEQCRALMGVETYLAAMAAAIDSQGSK